MLAETGQGGAGGRAGGLQEGSRRLRGDRILLRRQVDTENEHKHFMPRVKDGRVWLGHCKRLLDSGMHLAPGMTETE